jgi:outer membrane protein, multidrug efflux system
VLTAFGEVESLMANERLLRQGLADWQASYADAEEALRLGNYQYLAGAIDMVSLITVIEFSLGRQLDVIESEAALLRNRISLNLALGESY